MAKKPSKINSIAEKQQAMERQILKHEQLITNLREEVNSLSDHRILKMLEEKNSPYSDKPRYTYSEISSASGRSTGYISDLAARNGLSRRSTIRPV